MLKATVAIADHHDLEQVALERWRRAEEIDLRGAGTGEIAREPFQIAAMAAGDRDVVAHAVRLERDQVEAAAFDRVVDQLVVVSGAVAAEAVFLGAGARQGRRDAPGPVRLAGRRLDVDRARLVLPALDREEHGRAVEVGMRGVEVGGAHGEVPCVDLAGDRQRPLAGCALPAVLVHLRHGHRFPLPVARDDGHHMAGELAHQVAARDPDRQPQPLAGRVGVGHPQGDLEAVRFRRNGNDQVVDLFHVSQG
jgi:hypothetical protein